MNQEKINSILFQATNDADLSIKEIPSLDLYLDQIIKLISDKTAQGSEIFSDRIPTKTMVNNYSKAELISPLKGKTYSKEQIIQILLTNSLKNTLSIAEIKSIMDCIYKKREGATEDLYTLYESYIKAKETSRQLAQENAEKLMEQGDLSPDEPLDTLLLCLSLSTLADYFKCMSKALLKETASEILPDDASGEKKNDDLSDEDKKASKKAKKAAEKAAKKAAEESNEDFSQDILLENNPDDRCEE